MRRGLLFAFLLGVITISRNSGWAVDAQQAQGARHSAKQVLSIASAELRRSAENAARYKAKPPKYDAEKKAWWVFFMQNAPPFIVDGDLVVLVEDLTGSACVEQAIAVGPCTLYSVSSAISNLALAQSTDVRPSLEKTADCMLDALKAMPEVSEPKLGVATTEGWTHPFLEYRAAEALSRYYPIRFEAKKSERGGFWFLAVKSGIGAPEFHITDAVIQKWKVQCGADANVLFP